MKRINGMQKIFVNGPVYTGFIIDVAYLLENGYDTIQSKILKAIKTDQKKGWFIEGIEDSDSELLWEIKHHQTFSGSTISSPSLLVHQLRSEQKEFVYEGHTFTIHRVHIYFHDFGTAVYHIELHIELNGSMDLIPYRDMVSDFVYGDLRNSMNQYCKKDILYLKEILFRNKIPIESYEEVSKELKVKKSSEFIPLRSILWFHMIFTFEFESEITDEMINNLKPIVASSQSIGPQNCSIEENSALFPGFGFSLMMYNKHSYEFIDQPRVTELAQYFYAATTLLDTILFEKIADYSMKKRKRIRKKVIEAELKEIKALAEKLELFFLLLKDLTIHFSPTAKIVWRTLEREWYYLPMREGLKEKSDLLNVKYEELVDELNQKQAETLNLFVKIFTLIAIIGPLFETYSFLTGNQELINSIVANPVLLGSIIFISIIFISIIGYLLGKVLLEHY